MKKNIPGFVSVAGPGTVDARTQLDTVGNISRHGRFRPVNDPLLGLNTAIPRTDK